MKGSILNKKYENKEINEILDSNWKGMREVFSKQNAKKISKSFNNKILSYLAIESAIELLKKLGIFEEFEQVTSDMDDFHDFEDALCSFLVFGMSNEFEINKRLKGIKGNVGPLTIEIPTTSKEMFDIGIDMKNCLCKIEQIERYRNDELFVALSFDTVPVIAMDFEIENGFLKCTQAKRSENSRIEPHEYFFVAEMEVIIAKKLGLKLLKETNLQSGGEAQKILSYDEVEDALRALR